MGLAQQRAEQLPAIVAVKLIDSAGIKRRQAPSPTGKPRRPRGQGMKACMKRTAHLVAGTYNYRGTLPAYTDMVDGTHVTQAYCYVYDHGGALFASAEVDQI